MDETWLDQQFCMSIAGWPSEACDFSMKNLHLKSPGAKGVVSTRSIYGFETWYGPKVGTFQSQKRGWSCRRCEQPPKLARYVSVGHSFSENAITLLRVIAAMACQDVYMDIYSDILPDIVSDIFQTSTLTFYLANILTFYLIYFLSFYLTYILTVYLPSCLT